MRHAFTVIPMKSDKKLKKMWTKKTKYIVEKTNGKMVVGMAFI